MAVDHLSEDELLRGPISTNTEQPTYEAAASAPSGADRLQPGNDQSEVKADLLVVNSLLSEIPSLDMTKESCFNRMRGTIFDPGIRFDIEHIRDDRHTRLHVLFNELVPVVCQHLGCPTRSPESCQKVLNYLYALQTKTLMDLQRNIDIGVMNLPSAPVESSRLLGHLHQSLCACLWAMNGQVRDISEAQREPLGYCFQVTAFQWQEDIYGYWLDSLRGDKTRRYGSEGSSNEAETKNQQIESGAPTTGADNALRRRPGRPPGALNKSTIRKREQEAAAAVASQVPQSPILTPTTPTIPDRPIQIPQLQPNLFTPLQYISGRRNAMVPSVQSLSPTESPPSTGPQLPDSPLIHMHTQYRAVLPTCSNSYTSSVARALKSPFSTPPPAQTQPARSTIGPWLMQQVHGLSHLGPPNAAYFFHPNMNAQYHVDTSLPAYHQFSAMDRWMDEDNSEPEASRWKFKAGAGADDVVVAKGDRRGRVDQVGD